MQNYIKYIRLLTFILLIAPYCFLTMQILDSFFFHFRTDLLFWVLFLITLFPFSIVVLLTHIILKRINRKNLHEKSKVDDLKITFAGLGVFLGLCGLGLIFIVTS